MCDKCCHSISANSMDGSTNTTLPSKSTVQTSSAQTLHKQKHLNQAKLLKLRYTEGHSSSEKTSLLLPTIYSVAPRRTAIIHPSAPLQALTHLFVPSLNMLPNKQVWIWLLKGCSFRTRSMEDAYSHKLHLHEIQHRRATFCKGQLSSGVTVHLFLLQSLSSSSPFPHNHSEEILFCGASGHLPSEKFILHKKKEA